MTSAFALNPWAQIGAPATPLQTAAGQAPSMLAFPPTPLFAGYTPDDQTAARANREAIQALFDYAETLPGGGFVALWIRGTCWVDKAPLMGDNTELNIGHGVDLRIIDNANDPVTGCCVLGNKAGFLAVSQAIAVTSANAVWATAPDGNNTCIAITSATAGAAHPFGSYVSAVVEGHLVSTATAIQGGYFRGVWKVLESNASGIKYEVNKRNIPGSGQPGSTVYLYRANVNIKISGKGTIDGNGVNQVTPTLDSSGKTLNTGNPRGNVCWFRHVFGLTVEEVNFKRGRHWTFGTNYVRNYKVIYPTGDLHDPAGSSAVDFFHMVGQHQCVDMWVSNVYPGDNGIGMTIDQGDNPATPNYPQYDFDFENCGDLWEVHIHKFNGNAVNARGASFASVAFWGSPGYKFFTPIVENVSGATGISIANYAFTGLNETVIDKLTIRNVETIGGALTITGVHTIACLEMDGVRLLSQSGASGQAINNIAGTGPANIGKLVLRNVVSAPTSGTVGRTVPIMSLINANIGVVEVDNVENVLLGAGVPAFLHSGTGTLGRVILNRCSATNNVSGAGALWSSVGSTGVVGSITYNQCAYTGTASTGHMFLQGSGALYESVNYNNCVPANCAGLFGGQNATPTVNVFMNNTVVVAGCAYVGSFAGPTNLFVNGYHEVSAPTNNPFQTLTAAKLYNFKFENVSRDTDSITKTNGTLRFTGGGARTDGTKVDAPQPGDMFWNTNAAALTGIGMKGRTNAGAWANLF